MKQSRYTNIDLLRILACFMVVALHTACIDYYAVSVDSGSWMTFNFWYTATRSCVPLFVMISGMLTMSQEELSLKKLLTRSIPRLFVIFFLWSLLYAIDYIGPITLLRNFDLVTLMKTAWNYELCAPHLWYMPMFIGLYFIIPLLHPLRDKQTVLKYGLCMFVIMGVLRSTLAAFDETVFAALVLKRFDTFFASYIGYFILGYLLCTNRDKLRLSNTVLLVALAAIIGLTCLAVQLQSMASGQPQMGLTDNFFICTFLEAGILFLLFLRIPSEKIDAAWNRSGWVNKLAKYTLFVYLLHPFVLEHLESDLGITPTSANTLLTMPLISVGVFAVCMAIAFVIDLIPGVRKILL